VRDLSANPELAQAAAAALGQMPVEHALPAMLKEWADLNKKRFKETAYPIVTTALLASAQKMTGALGTTVADFELWWSRELRAVPREEGPHGHGDLSPPSASLQPRAATARMPLRMKTLLIAVAGLFFLQQDPIATEAMRGYKHPWADFGDASSVTMRETIRGRTSTRRASWSTRT
jgi:hypothetical protein